MLSSPAHNNIYNTERSCSIYRLGWPSMLAFPNNYTFPNIKQIFFIAIGLTNSLIELEKSSVGDPA